MLNIPETTLDRAIVTIERQYEVVCALSHGDISSDLDRPLTQFSRARQGQSFYKTLLGNHTQSIEWYHVQ